ncbi:MAG: 30S ribosomal protein S8 [Patescibacteria group bacterium]
MTDPIADMINRIKNAQRVGHTSVVVPYSKLLWNVAEILEKEGFISAAQKRGRKIVRTMELTLKYSTEKEPRVHGVRRVSKPSCRIYENSRALKSVKQGTGLAIVSTSKGLMTNSQARTAKMGGEIMFEIW